MSDVQTFVVRLRGGSHTNGDGSSRQTFLAECRRGNILTLRAEPRNPHDRHAVAVLDGLDRQLGYLPSDARDASSLLRGEGILAEVERLIGGPRWWHGIFGIKRHYGLLIRLKKVPIDWAHHNLHRSIAQEIDVRVREAVAYEKSGAPTAAVIAKYQAALTAAIDLNGNNPIAAAHRYENAPINRLTMLLVKEKRLEDARRAYLAWTAVVDPVGITKSEKEQSEKRMAKILAPKKID